MPDKLTEEEFAAKVEWEGGIGEALSYGLKASDLQNPDSELGKAWARLERIWTKEVRPAVAAVEKLLPEEAW
jgi:hypothetical protein